MPEANAPQPAPPLALAQSPGRADSEPVPASPARSPSSLKERFSRFSLLPGRRRESADAGKRASIDGGGASSGDTAASRTNSMPADATPASSVESEPFQSIRGGSAKDKERLDKERAQRAAEQAHQKRLTLARRMQSDLRAAQVETPEERGRYGDGVPAAGWANDYSALVPLESIDAEGVGETIVLRARIHAKRTLSPHLAFLFLRQQTSTLQAVVAESRGGLSLHAAKWIERLPVESIVFMRGTLAKPRERVLGATIHDVELQVTDCFLVSRPTIDLPFTVYEADRAPLSGAHADKAAKHSESDADDDDDAPSDTDSPRHSRHLEGAEASPRPSRLDELSPTASSSEQPRSSVSSRRRSAHGLPGAPPPAAVSKRTRLSNRILDIRSPASQAIFRINSRVSTQFRASLLSQGFLEIHTPKLQAGSSESGSSVFQLDYFGRPAFLAQSPQLYKQMAISADLQRVFEIGPVFRAENSNTARHLTEYTGLDLEMQIITDYHEAMRVIDTMLKSVFSALQTHCKREIELVQRHWPHEDLVWLDETPVIEFKEGVKMLVESGWKEENGEPPAEDEDLSTRGEARLCELVKQKYKTDYFILDKFPASVRPFYTHLDPENPRFTNSFDILLRGTEICTGGQRIHDARKLEARIREAGVDARSLDEYMEAFRLGVSPHAGCGIGLERILTTFLGLGDVRWSTLFFRDPKSLPLDHRPPPLRHPEADTLAAASRAALAEHDAHASPEDAPAPAPLAKTPSANGEASTPAKPLVVAQPEPEGDGAQLADGPPSKWPLAKLIANYGDSSNTSWLDSRFQVWRHDASGGAVGFVKRGKFAIVVGNPLCDHTQYRLVIDAFLAHLREKEKLKPIWLLVGEEVEHILGGRLDWSSLMCVVEQRVPKEGRAAAIRGGDIEKKLRKAEREDLHIDEYGFRDEIPQDVKAEVEKRIEDWKKSREGKQLHLTMVDPWQDEGHRAYYVTRSKDKKIQCLVVLAQLSPANGFQIKWALDFPGAISGAIEYTIVHAVSEFGGDSFTFGASAAANFHTVHNLGGLRVRALSKTYAAISAAAGLGGKNDFRKKIGARDEPLYIAFPRHGLRHGGVRAIMNFFEE